MDELSDDESEVGELVHESLKPSASKRDRAPSSSKKYIPPDETHVDRDRRTVFIGNLPIECAKAKVSSSILPSERSVNPASLCSISFVPTSFP